MLRDVCEWGGFRCQGFVEEELLAVKIADREVRKDDRRKLRFARRRTVGA